MDLFFHRCLDADSRRNTVSVLAFFWLCGIALGALCSGFADDVFPGFLHDAVPAPASAFGTVICSIFPIFLSWIASLVCRKLIYPIAFLFAFVQSFYWLLFIFAFGDAGWLVCSLYFFSSIFTTPILLLCWSALILEKTRSRCSLLLVSLLLCGLIGTIDYTLISPFLQKILS